jgi:hypothetical protein
LRFCQILFVVAAMRGSVGMAWHIVYPAAQTVKSSAHYSDMFIIKGEFVNCCIAFASPPVQQSHTFSYPHGRKG